ncbi:MAG: hypothetical protein Q8N01_07635 [Sulfuricurvum sp.]|nr:hypothetical protein [Sulfuricurvum sp.]MDP3021893.1 hypothetical protein [Sulfuricurvum sp.]MDP3120269.1 hypothetical protein [Sulfuricurvum sp.]
MTHLKEKLTDFGCSSEFINIAMGYAQFYKSDMDTEAFIEYVEEEHAKVEEAEALAEREGQVFDASAVLAEFSDEEE